MSVKIALCSHWTEACTLWFLHVCVYIYIRVNLSMWRWSVKSWRPTLQSTSLQDTSPTCPNSSQTTACWLRNASYDFSAGPRSDKSSSRSEEYRPMHLSYMLDQDGSSLRCKVTRLPSAASLSGVYRPRVPLWGSSSHRGGSSRLCVPSATIWPTALIRQQRLLQRQAHHETGRQHLQLKRQYSLNWRQVS